MSELLHTNVPAPAWPPSGGAGSCRADGPATREAITAAIRGKYAEVAVSAEGKFAYPTGRSGAIALGYDSAILERAPAALLESFCGVGNPFSLGPIRAGETILDVGSGAGLDLFIASMLAGANAGVQNAELKQVDGEAIPYEDHAFDVVISNGVINLAPDKQALFQEIYRVLKPGGRLQFADVVLEKELPANLVGSADAWSQWVGGTIPVGDLVELMKKAGFADAGWLGMTGFRTSEYTGGALFRGTKK
jgi:arsenite methyltransferase